MSRHALRLPVCSLVFLALGACSSDQGQAPQVAASLTVFPAAFDVPLNGSALMSVTAYDSKGGTILTPIIAFKSSNPAIATVSGAGLVTGKGVGYDTVTAVSGSASATAIVAVVTHPAGTAAGAPSVGSRPFGVAISATGVALVSRQDLPYLQRSVLPDSSFPDSILVGTDPNDIAFTGTGDTAYVTNQAGGTVGIIDVASKQMVDTIPINGTTYGAPYRVRIGTDDGHIYVSTGGGWVLEISTATDSITQKWPLSGYPVNGLAFRPDGTILYATSTGGGLFEITPSTGLVRGEATGETLQDIAVSLASDELWIAVAGGDVLVLNAATGALVTTVTGATDAFGLTRSPDGTKFYASVPTAGNLIVIDHASRSVSGTLGVGGTPRRIAFNRFGTEALVANEGNYISVVQ